MMTPCSASSAAPRFPSPRAGQCRTDIRTSIRTDIRTDIRMVIRTIIRRIIRMVIRIVIRTIARTVFRLRRPLLLPADRAFRSILPSLAAIVVVIAAGAGLAVWFLADSPAENTQPDAVQYGTNLEEITFSAKDGSRLIFQAVRRTDSLSLDDMTDRICSSELERMSSSEVILNHVKDNYGKVIVTGWDNERDGYTDYCLTKIKQDTILRMTVQFPGYTNDDDELRMGYLTETFYRMCGFSDADPWRTYEEYIRENG